jgi:hypothetical protein
MSDSLVIVDNYQPPVSRLLSLGQPKHAFTMNYAALGMTPEHVPELLRMVADEALHGASGHSKLVWAPVHAWRALAEFKAEAAIAPLLGLLERFDDENDDWVGEDVPRVLGELGRTALEPVAAYLADPAHKEWARVAAAEALTKIGERYADLRADCVVRLSAQLEKFAEQSEMLNAFLVVPLLDLKARKALPVVERAFAAGQVDESVTGDYEDCEIELGLKTERQHSRKPNKLTEIADELRALLAADGLIDPLLDDLSGVDRPVPYVSAGKTGRNEPCPCGSGKKYKKCCGKG